MKRFIVLLLITAVIVGALIYAMPKGLDDYIDDISGNAVVSIYCRNANVEGINMGNGKIVQCSVADFNSVIAQCYDVDGFSVAFDGTEQDIVRVAKLFKLNVTSTLNMDGLLIVCGNSTKLSGGVNIDGVTVNLQIAYKDGTVTVGSPLILGSY